MRKFMINVNGTSYEVEVEEIAGGASMAAPAAAPVAAPKAAPAAAPAPKAAAGAVAGTEVKAPMPGTVLSVAAQVGTAVKNGDVLLVLEAMKMENDIVAPCEGTVKAINVSKDDTVNSGDLLVVIG